MKSRVRRPPLRCAPPPVNSSITRSVTASLTDVMAGRVQLYMSGLPPVLPLVADGRVKAIAVTTAGRSPAAPNVPTLAEAGLPGYDVTLWYGLFAPAGVSPAAVMRLNQAIVKALASPDVRQKFMAQGVEPTTSAPEVFRKLVDDETARWRSLIQAAGIKLE